MALSGWATDKYLALASAPVTAVPLTLACWYKPSAVNAVANLIMLRNAAATNVFTLRINASGNVQARTVGAGAANGQSTAALVADTWYHLAAVFSAVNARAAYINGAVDGTNATSQTPSNIAAFDIGIESNTPAGPALGSLCHVAIWNTALSASAIARLARGQNPLNGSRHGLVGYWPLETVANATAIRRHGTAMTATGVLTLDSAVPGVRPAQTFQILAGAL